MDSDLLLQHQRYLRRLVRGLAGDGPAADDLEQATWLAALEHPPRSSDVLRAWLARVARNLSLNRRRAEAHEALRRARSGGERSWPPADEIAAELELAERVLAAVRALPEELRAAVHARYYEELELAEIARRTGVPAETIKDRLERARALLRTRLGRDVGGERGLGALLALARRGASSLAGGMLVKKIVALVALVLVVVLAFRMLDRRAERSATPPRNEALAAVPADVDPAPVAAPVLLPERESIVVEQPAPVPETALRTGSLLVEVTWPDGTPAQHVFARVSPAEEGDLARFHRGAATSAEGTCSFAALEPGSYRVQLEREKDFALVEVRADEEALLELAVSPGPRAKGIVVDERGEPIGGAGVWISTRYVGRDYAPLDDAPAAITGPDGRFDIPSVGKAWLIGARADGHAPSHEKPLGRFRVPEVEVRLVLPGLGGTIEGRVLDPTGAPVEGATITADVGFRFARYPQGGMLILNSLHLQTRSSPDGTFRFTGVQPGEVELVIASREHGGWRGKIEVEASATAHVVAPVDPGGAVWGRILATDGTPIAGVLVLASLESRTEPVQAGSPYLEKDWSFVLETSRAANYAVTRSRSDGSYRVTGLPEGWSFVVAQNDDAGRALESVRLRAGEEQRRDLVLARGLELACRIVDPSGKPLAHLPVFVARVANEAEGTTYGSRGPYPTDLDGRLRVPNCQDALYVLDIRHARYENHRLASLDNHGLRPGPLEHRILVDYQDPPVASVRGIVLDDGGRPLAGARVDLVLESGGSNRIADSGPDGSFLAEGFQPGTYGLWIRAPDFPYMPFPAREFPAGETIDLGTLQAKTPGFLDVRASREDGEPLDDELWDADLYWGDGSYWWSRFEVELGVARSDPIEPGDYVLKVPGAPDRPVHIEAGVTREVEVVLPAAK